MGEPPDHADPVNATLPENHPRHELAQLLRHTLYASRLAFRRPVMEKSMSEKVVLFRTAEALVKDRGRALVTIEDFGSIEITKIEFDLPNLDIEVNEETLIHVTYEETKKATFEVGQLEAAAPAA